MRGKDQIRIRPYALERITPAYAGKSRQSGKVQIVVKDHPRLCGEKETACFRHFLLPGSPPPMRGKAC